MTRRMKRFAGIRRACLRSGVTFLLVAAYIAVAVSDSSADPRTDAAQQVATAQMTLSNFAIDSNMGAFNDLIKRAKGVFIAPQILKGAFIFGASGGSGVLVAWNEKSRKWGGPAFYVVGGGSFGLQIGGEASEVVLLAMTERGVKAMTSSSFKLGADAGIAAGPVGVGASASTVNLSADVLSFSRSKGLYGGISLDGAVVATRNDWNEAYYGKKVDPIDILIFQDVNNPEATALIEAVERMSGRK